MHSPKLSPSESGIRKIAIVDTEILDGYATYIIEVTVEDYSWVVKRRYSDFHNLHEKLVKSYNLGWGWLPPKKLIGNLKIELVEKRKVALEKYLRNVITKLKVFPKSLKEFLEFYNYDVCGVTQTLAMELYEKGDIIIASDQMFTLTPLQVHCISKRIQMPIPTYVHSSGRYGVDLPKSSVGDKEIPHADIGNLYDFIYRLKHLKISGLKQKTAFTSDVDLVFDMTLFKSLESLQLDDVDVEYIQDLEFLQENLHCLIVHTSIKMFKDLLLDAEVWQTGLLSYVKGSGRASFDIRPFRRWKKVKKADFSSNGIKEIDASVALMPELEVLDISHNELSDIDHLQSLSELKDLDLSFNSISNVEHFYLKLGNIKRLVLTGNSLESILGLERLYSLEYLDLSYNNLHDFGELLTLGNLPCLEALYAHGNAVSRGGSYRVRVFTAFGDRASQLRLDGQYATSVEMAEIRTMLEEEESYEIISLPHISPALPPTLPSKPGHKKNKSRDRIISIHRQISEVLEESNSSADSPCMSEDEDTQFRSKIESLRQMGGESWLQLFNEMQHDSVSSGEGSSLPSKPQHIKKKQALKPGASSSLPRNKLKQDESKTTKERTRSEVAVRTNEPQDTSTKKSEPNLQVLVDDRSSPKVQFGFSQDVEDLVIEKLKTSKETVTGTFMVSVDHDSDPEDSDLRLEDRMVGVDLQKGVMMEIQIDSGKTCAKHKLDDISSVDIMEANGTYVLDIRETKDKEWRRHSFNDVTQKTKDYKHVAKYKMRSLDDTAELFVLLYKYITHSWSGLRSPLSPYEMTTSGTSTTVESSQVMSNPLGISEALLSQFFKEHMYNTEVDSEETVCVLWTGCLPYSKPDEELPVCMLVTNIRVYLFHILLDDTVSSLGNVTCFGDINELMRCFKTFSVTSIHEVMIGMYDQGFRVEVAETGAEGTFTFLTRDTKMTSTFLQSLADILDFSIEPNGKGNSGPGRLSLVYPNEEKLLRLRDQFVAKNEEDLIMYSLVREVDPTRDSNVGYYSNQHKTLIATNMYLYLCEEDHVHWPLPSFVRAPPSTPQWVTSRVYSIKKIVGIDIYDIQAPCQFFGGYGMTLLFDNDQDDSLNTSFQENEQNAWNLVFKSEGERELLQKALSQIWKDNFDADLAITTSKPRVIRHPQVEHVLPVNDTTCLADGSDSPVTSPKLLSPKTHKRVGSDSSVIFKACLEGLVHTDAVSLGAFFREYVALRGGPEVEVLKHTLLTGCIPYLFPLMEIKAFVILSNVYIHILVEKEHAEMINAGRKVPLPFSRSAGATFVYHRTLKVRSLQQVCVGLFDQSFRLECESPEETFTFITRDYNLTGSFLDSLNTVLSYRPHEESSLVSEQCRGSVKKERSIYDCNSKSYDHISGMEAFQYMNPNCQVQFVCPTDDTLENLKYNILRFAHQNETCPPLNDITILVYLLLFQTNEDGVRLPMTFIVMDQAVCVCVEDHVDYPLPLFATGLPDHSQYQVQDVRLITNIARVEFSDFNSCDFTLVFKPLPLGNNFRVESDNINDVCVVTHINRTADLPTGETVWKLTTQTYEEKEKALSLLCKLWADQTDGKLPVMRSQTT